MQTARHNPTLIVSKGWPTVTQHTPPNPPAKKFLTPDVLLPCCALLPDDSIGTPLGVTCTLQLSIICRSCVTFVLSRHATFGDGLGATVDPIPLFILFTFTFTFTFTIQVACRSAVKSLDFFHLF